MKQSCNIDILLNFKSPYFIKKYNKLYTLAVFSPITTFMINRHTHGHGDFITDPAQRIELMKISWHYSVGHGSWVCAVPSPCLLWIFMNFRHIYFFFTRKMASFETILWYSAGTQTVSYPLRQVSNHLERALPIATNYWSEIIDRSVRTWFKQKFTSNPQPHK